MPRARTDPAPSLDAIRGRLRALRLVEQASGTSWSYAALEEAGFGMGSKLGPSISLPLEDAERMALLRDGFARLQAGESPAEAASP
jgi:hypothetical protein